MTDAPSSQAQAQSPLRYPPKGSGLKELLDTAAKEVRIDIMNSEDVICRMAAITLACCDTRYLDIVNNPQEYREKDPVRYALLDAFIEKFLRDITKEYREEFRKNEMPRAKRTGAPAVEHLRKDAVFWLVNTIHSEDPSRSLNSICLECGKLLGVSRWVVRRAYEDARPRITEALGAFGLEQVDGISIEFWYAYCATLQLYFHALQKNAETFFKSRRRGCAKSRRNDYFAANEVRSLSRRNEGGLDDGRKETRLA